MSRERPDSIIFDLDGTLWDASRACANAWNKSMRQAEIFDQEISDEFIRSVSGLRIDMVMDTHFNFIPRDKQKVLLDYYRVNEKVYMRNEGGPLYEGVRETISLLKKEYKLLIVSNCLSGYIENFLERNELKEFFIDFECSGNTGNSKADNILAVIKRNSLRASVYVGDTIWDQEAAYQAGIPFIFAAYGFGNVTDAEHLISQPSDLVALLQTFN